MLLAVSTHISQISLLDFGIGINLLCNFMALKLTEYHYSIASVTGLSYMYMLLYNGNTSHLNFHFEIEMDKMSHIAYLTCNEI